MLPFAKTGDRVRRLIKDARIVVIKDGHQSIPWTHADQLNETLRDFIPALATA